MISLVRGDEHIEADVEINNIFSYVDTTTEQYHFFKRELETSLGDFSVDYYQQLSQSLREGVPGLIFSYWLPRFNEDNAIFSQKLIDSLIIKRYENEKFHSTALNVFYKYLSHLAIDRGWQCNSLYCATEKEILDILSRKSFAIKSVLNRSSDNFYYILDEVFSEERIEAKLFSLGFEVKAPHLQHVPNTIEGTSAYKGIATGRVKLLFNSSDCIAVKEGDVIISPMTTPNFTESLKKAVAFVTDEGGITCHAAIVAREMKKPCVIGTKIATQVLEDGMMVEVDADEGTVRIVEDH